MAGQVVAQALHTLLVSARQINTGDGVEAYQVDTALYALHQLDNLATVGQRVVQSAEADIFKRAAPLVGEVILPQQVGHLPDAHLALGGHQRLPLLVQGRVHRNSHVALALVEKPLQLALQPHAAHGDALGAPGVTVVGRQYLCGAQHGVEVVHRLALAHKHDVGQQLALGQGIDLVQDVGGREVALPALLACLAEEAVHLAPHLARHAQRAPLAVGNEDRLHTAADAHGEQVFHRAVLTALTVDRRHGAYLEVLLEQLAVGLRQVGHPVNGHHMLLVEPAGYLSTPEGGHTKLTHSRFQLCGGHSHQYSLRVVHTVIVDFSVQSY